MRNELRLDDIAGRWGGEEFLVILPRTPLEGAVDVGERIRAAIAATPIVASGNELTVTVSGGCAGGPPPHFDLVQQADTHLYEAKGAGRNRIIATESRALETNHSTAGIDGHGVATVAT
jgi:diguanylate cyclase (GGDEF)-like protein